MPSTPQKAIDNLTAGMILLTVPDECDQGHAGGGSPPRQIRSISELKEGMETLCKIVFGALGKQQPEGAYQQALEVELRRCGVQVEQEVVLCVMYRGVEISSRRIDLRLRLSDESQAIVEMKAIKTLTKGANSKAETSTNCVRQLQYYMDELDVEHGFLVNFPHESGFPPPPSGATFVQELICGVKDPLSDMQLRDRNRNYDAPEILYFRRIKGS